MTSRALVSYNDNCVKAASDISEGAFAIARYVLLSTPRTHNYCAYEKLSINDASGLFTLRLKSAGLLRLHCPNASLEGHSDIHRDETLAIIDEG